ncbi:GTP-binding protein [uncultured Nitrospira sp.]|uniref:GTP-binding protein n=1 Tax=uncultured Nitrospira sp. TaxID=157176 RepID=UPI00313FF953
MGVSVLKGRVNQQRDTIRDHHAGVRNDQLQPIPLTVLTGFLGGGKTTRLNRILNDDHDLGVIMLVNDFGAINIDADPVVGIENNGAVISLTNGTLSGLDVMDELSHGANCSMKFATGATSSMWQGHHSKCSSTR